MELQGSGYLFNLSVLSITFAAVSALVMLLRQTMGGRLSNFDVYLITSFVSFGFVVAVDAILPELFFQLNLGPSVLWVLASGVATALQGVVASHLVRLRLKASPQPMSRWVLATYLTQALACVILLANAVVQNAGLFGLALTLSLMGAMVGFVRRISSLFGDKPGEDWDPKRG